jgi:hypothetical protein
MLTRGWFFAAVLMLMGVVAAPAQLTSEAALNEPQYGPAASDQSSPVVATDGVDFLVAWWDSRSPATAIYANRVTHDGHVLDGTGIRLPVDPGAANGRLIGAFYVEGAYTIVYSYQSFAPTSSFHTIAAIISTDGHLIDGPRAILDEQYLSVGAGATNGSRIVLVSAAETIVLNGRAQVVDRFALPTGPSYGLSIASNGSTFLVGMLAYDAVSNASNSVNLIALDVNGKPTNVTTIAASASADGPVIASDGSDYLVLYNDVRTPVAQYVGAHAEIRSTTILHGGPYPAGRHALVWTGHSYLAVATTNGSSQQMELFSLDRSGSPISSARRPGAGTPGIVNEAATAWNGSTALLAWTSGSQEATDALEVVGTLTNADATATSPVMAIPSASNMQVAPVLATSGSQDLAVWIEPTGVYATRITPEGKALDGRGIAVSSQSWPSRSLSVGGVPALRAIYDGTSYLVVWGDSNGVTAQRIDPATGSLEGSPIALAQCSRSLDLGIDNDLPVLFNADCSDGRVYAQRVGAMAPVGEPVAISPSDMLANAPRAAWNGTEWLVVWSKLVASPLLISPPIYRSAAVYGARVSPALTLSDVQPIQIAAPETNDEIHTENFVAPLVATDGREFLVVWWRQAFDATDGLYLRRVQTEGSMGDAERLLSGSPVPQSIVCTGARYAIAYARSDAAWNDDLFLTHTSSRTNDPLAGYQITLSATPTDERFISLVASPGRSVRVIYTRVATEPQYGGVSHVFIRDAIDATRRRSVGRR